MFAIFIKVLVMKNRPNHAFRMKIKKPRQTYIQVYSDNQEDPTDERSFNSRFSSEYISLANKFNIKIISQERKSGALISGSLNKADRNRVKTEFARSKDRSKGEEKLFQAEPQPHSFQLNGQNTNRSNRSSKLALFNLNRNTVYNGAFFKLKTEADNSLFIHEQSIKLSLRQGYEILFSLATHARKLLNIRQSLSRRSLSEHEVIREVKVYVLAKEANSICKIDRYLQKDSLKKQIKQLVAIQRMVLLSIVSHVVGRHLFEMLEDVNRALEIILGFWFQIINATYEDNMFKLEMQQQSQLKQIISALAQAKLLTKSNIRLLLDTLTQKLPVLFKHSKHLYSKISYLLTFSQEVSINRAFYELLTIFATFLTEFETRHQINLDNISFFATCPSPYLTRNSQKSYSLVVDLDQTLVYSSFKGPANLKERKTETVYRPGCFDFIEQLSGYYEIIVFTTSLEVYAREVTRSFKGIDHYLFRQHAVRVKSGLVKDLSRIGRDLNRVIILDDMASNFRYQKDNGIRIKPWRGDMQDNQLETIKQLLVKIAQNQAEDLKTDLNSFRVQLSKKGTTSIEHSHKKKP